MQIVRAYPRHLSLAVPLFDQYRQFHNQPLDGEGARQFLTERLSNGDSVIFLALDGSGSRETGIGFLQLYPLFSSTQMRPAWLLNDLFVVPSARRQGIARALVERAHHLALETRACQLILQTGSENTAGQALCESLGYVRDTGTLLYVLPIAK